MNTIHELLLESEAAELEAGLVSLMKTFKASITEGVTDLPQTDVMGMFDEATRRLDAAKRGLGLSNKLPPEERRANKSRIMGNMNRLRALIYQILKKVDAENFSLNHSMAQDGNRNKLGTTPQQRPAAGIAPEVR